MLMALRRTLCAYGSGAVGQMNKIHQSVVILAQAQEAPWSLVAVAHCPFADREAQDDHENLQIMCAVKVVGAVCVGGLNHFPPQRFFVLARRQSSWNDTSVGSRTPPVEAPRAGGR